MSMNSCELFSSNSNAILKNKDEIKNKLREDLRDKVTEISRAGDGADASNENKETKTKNSTDQTKQTQRTTIDYFELVYQCIEKRRNFLNVVRLNAHNPVEPDIDEAILKALLNGKYRQYEFQQDLR